MSTLHSRLGVEWPLIQAPMAGSQNAALAIAVSEAGGLGSLPCAMLSETQLASELERIMDCTAQPVNLNFFCHVMPAADAERERRWREALVPYYREFGIDPDAPMTAVTRQPIDDGVVTVLERFRPRVVSFHFGLPEARLFSRIKRWGAFVLASATTVAEGRWLQQHGADAVIAQGIEAGGHRGHFLSMDLSLQPSTRELVSGLADAMALPVIAAGGIASHDDVVALRDAGAAAVQIGTAYLRCHEATTSAVHRAALDDVQNHATALTDLFSGRPARGLMNRLMRDLGPLSTLAPAFPLASVALAPLRAHAERLGRGDFSPLWAGTKINSTGTSNAAALTRRLAGYSHAGD